ncbi:hypothetical protein AB0A99_15315 [Streptomyces fradiae]|uniref:hypothetical protein n=1 Tax=Streptomyces fradiae TaxID=1906 RepID=UPI0033D887DB
MARREFEERNVLIRRGWRQLTTAGRVRVAGGRLTLLNSIGGEIDSAPLSRVRVAEPWYVPRGVVRAALGGTVYLLRLDPSRAGEVMDAAHRARGQGDGPTAPSRRRRGARVGSTPRAGRLADSDAPDASADAVGRFARRLSAVGRRCRRREPRPPGPAPRRGAGPAGGR